MKTQIAVATHKLYEMPSDSCYLPIHAGKEVAQINLPYQGDNTGCHISGKNASFNELTVLYWLWKNEKADYKGLAHYRRYFSLRSDKNKNDILSKDELDLLFAKYDVLLPQKKKYYIMSAYTHYIYSKRGNKGTANNDLFLLRNTISELYPSYIDAYDKVMASSSLHMCNMFVMKDRIFDGYCEFLFNVLFELEKNSCFKDRTRIFGALSEFLLDVYLDFNKIDYYEVKMLELEKVSLGQKIINRIKIALFK